MYQWKSFYMSVYLLIASSSIWAAKEDISTEPSRCDGLVMDASGQLQQRFKEMTAGQVNDPVVVPPKESGCFLGYVFGEVATKLTSQEKNPDVAARCMTRFFTEPQPHKVSNNRTAMVTGEDLLMSLIRKPQFQDKNAVKVFGHFSAVLYKMARSPQYCPELYDKTK
ncbi:MAG: hypothetical protein AB2665_05330 [Candidatus Thiodiazotropha sp.]